MFGGETVPEGVALLADIDWSIGMLRTVTNVTGDAVVCGLVAHLCPIEDALEMEGVMSAANLTTDTTEVDETKKMMMDGSSEDVQSEENLG